MDIPLWWLILFVVITAGIVVIPATLLTLQRVAKRGRLSLAKAIVFGSVAGGISLGLATGAYIIAMLVTGSWTSAKAVDVLYPTAVGALYGFVVALVRSIIFRHSE